MKTLKTFVPLSALALATLAPAAQAATLSLSQKLGGNGLDEALAVCADPQGNYYVAGTTSSTDFPTNGAFQAHLAGNQDAFVAKFSTNGTIIYATYLGGTLNDVATGIAVDTNGNIYVTGYTQSTNFPTVNALQATNAGGFYDVFVAKFNPAGDTLLYSTYIGGKDYDTAGGIAVDPLGNAVVTGYTQSTNFPTANAAQPAFGGIGDAFVFKLSADGSSLVYSTYLGGSGQENRNNSDLGGAVAVDLAGNAYLTGWTYSTNFPVLNALQPTNATSSSSGTDAFVTKLSPSGAVLYSTYLGGYFSDKGRAITVDQRGQAFVTGTSASDYLFPTKNPWQSIVAGEGSGGIGDIFIAALGSTGTNLIYSTFLGGTGDEQPNGISVDAEANVAVAGFTDSPDFPLMNPTQPVGNQTLFQSANGGNSWSASHSGLVGNGILAMQVAPNNPTVLYVVTKQGTLGSGGLFKSTDAGATWVEQDSGMDYRSTELTSLAVAASQPNTLYAASWAAGVLKSSDAGANWTEFTAGLPDPYGFGTFDVEAIAVDPTNPDIVYAGTFSSGLYKSVDGGTNWFAATNGMAGLRPRTILIDPLQNATVYAGCADLSGIQVYRSNNGGTNWTRLAGGLNPGPAVALAFNPTNSAMVYAIAGPSFGNYLMQSTDRGTNWSSLLQASGFPFTALAIDPNSPATLWLGSDGSAAPGAGVFKSADAGTNWQLAGLNSDKILTLLISPTNSQNVLAGVDGGRDAFFATISSNGVPTFSTYLGGTGGDEARALAPYHFKGACLAGFSAAQDYPTAAARLTQIRKHRPQPLGSQITDTVSPAEVGGLVSLVFASFQDLNPCPPPELIDPSNSQPIPQTSTFPLGSDFVAAVVFNDSPTIDFQIEGTLPPAVSENLGLSGALTQAGTFTFSVIATNNNCRSTNTYTVIVTCPPPKLVDPSNNQSIPANSTFPLGSDYSAVVTLGNMPTADFQIEGALPPGIAQTLGLNGTFKQAGTFTFSVVATVDNCRTTNSYTITVTAAPPQLTGIPSSARPGELIRITGTNLCFVTNVCFNGVCTTNFGIGNGCTNLDVFVPAGASTGRITVAGGAGIAESATDLVIPPEISIVDDVVNNRVVIDYQSGQGYLQYAPALEGPWQILTGTPPVFIPFTNQIGFFRLMQSNAPPVGP